MTIYIGNHMPAISLETLGGIVCEPALNVTVDRDAVVIPECDQLAKTESTGQ